MTTNFVQEVRQLTDNIDAETDVRVQLELLEQIRTLIAKSKLTVLNDPDFMKWLGRNIPLVKKLAERRREL